MKRLTVIPIVALCGALAATSSNVAIARVQGEAGAERVLTETLYDVSEGALLFPCSDDGEPLPEGEGEPIAIQGFIAERFMSVDKPSGGVHYTVKTRPEGVHAFGETSGEEFRIRDSVQFVGNERLDGWTLSYRQDFKMVGSETHRTFWVVAKGHYLILPDGTIILHRDIVRSECRA